MTASLAVRDLSKRYGTVEAVRSLGFDVAPGEVFGLLGANGAGKTTTIECITGLTTPDRGSVTVGGTDVSRDPAATKQRIGVALQSTGLHDKITPREALGTFAAFYDRPTRADVLLDRFGLAQKADVRFETLSGGQRQRLGLALAFVNDPDVVLLDEPTAGLDTGMRRELHQHILAIKADGRAVVIATHDMEEAEQLCNRIAIIDQGTVVATGTPHELIARSRSTVRVKVVLEGPLSPPRLELVAATDVSVDGMTLRVDTTDLTATMTDLLAKIGARGIGLETIEARKATLGEVVLALAAGRANR